MSSLRFAWPKRALPSIILVTLLASLVIPTGAPQVGDPQYCQGSPGHVNTGDTADNPTIPHLDLTIAYVRAGAGNASSFVPATEVGEHLVIDNETTNEVTIRVGVENIGQRNATQDDGNTPFKTELKVTLAKVGGSGQTKTARVDTPAPNNVNEASVTFTVTDPGRQSVSFALNAPHDPREECTDEGGVPRCVEDNAPVQCTTTYYNNNGQGDTTNLLVNAFPDLAVDGLDTDPPERTDSEENEASTRAGFSPTITNRGDVIAYDLATTSPNSVAGRFTVWLNVTECEPCDGLSWEVDALQPGESVTLEEKTLDLAGVIGDYNVSITVDPNNEVYESTEDDNHVVLVERIPTPELSLELSVDASLLDGVYVVPKGQPLFWNVTVVNDGDGPARNDDDSAGFQTIAFRSSTANNVFNQKLNLAAFSSQGFTMRDEAVNVTGSQNDPIEYTIRVDVGDAVLEGDETNNELSFQVFAAEYKHELTVRAADADTEVPPGVSAKVPFELENTGTVRDTFRLGLPGDQRGTTRYLNAQGDTITEVILDTGATFKGEFERDIPRTATKGTVFENDIRVQSASVANVTRRAVTFTVGDDTVAPRISLEDPASGFLNGDRALMRVTDNVNVTKVEADVGGTFVAVAPETTGSTLYAVDVTGQPGTFSFTVRAEDAAGNTAEEEVTITRDSTPPRITDVVFTPTEGLAPGQQVTLVVVLLEDNPDTVETEITQGRGINELYKENRELQRGPANFQLRDWVVAERPGNYRFNITATDLAGNSATLRTNLTVPGFDLTVVNQRPTPSTSNPAEGERVQLSWAIQNTNDQFSSGRFFVQLGVDNLDKDNDARPIGLRGITLEPGGRQLVTFDWVVERGPTVFALAIDQSQSVDESRESDNLVSVSTEAIWGTDYALFHSQDTDEGGFSSFGQRVADYWFVPTIFVAVVLLGIVALALGRRPTS